MSTRTSTVLLFAACLTACASEPVADAPLDLLAQRGTPDDAPEGSCWHNAGTPALIETTERKILVRQASISADGKTRFPAEYRVEVEERTIRPQADDWVQIVCPKLLTQDFISAIQRALKARGYYDGPATGRLDSATRQSVRRFQLTQGRDLEKVTQTLTETLGLTATRS
mgnify:FL=1